MKIGHMNFRGPKAPKICAIGLRNHGNINEIENPFWTIAELKKLLQQYFNIIRRYFKKSLPFL